VSSAIETRGLEYRAGREFALHDLGLNVPAGSIYGFLGPNGAGKTTTIRLLLGMTRRDGGEIRLLGRSVPAELPTVLGLVGYVPERPHVYPALTVAQAMRLHGVFHERSWDGAWAERLREQFALRPEQRVGRLSKGESGKLHMLLALAQRPELLVLDEPTDGLDPMVRRDVLTALLDYVGGTGATVFISSHLVHELERMCDWVGVLDAGRLVSELPIDEFKSGIKRLRVAAPADVSAPPFTLLSRNANGLGAGEVWVVRGWEAGMDEFFTARGGAVREVIDLDLEEVFVELLRAARQPS
jgi:ABC-2 type transport system ATP-binding protein